VTAARRQRAKPKEIEIEVVVPLFFISGKGASSYAVSSASEDR
jgi:hypothetical protein